MLRERSSGSVRVFWLDQEVVIQKLREAARKLKERFPEVQKVILFGSLARGDALPGSDADLLLVLEKSDLPFVDRSARYMPAVTGIGVDVLVYTRNELEQMQAGGNAFVKQALADGVELLGE